MSAHDIAHTCHRRTDGGPPHLPCEACGPKLTTRCVRCRAEFTDAQIQGANACPLCGDIGVPMAVARDVDVRVNWHELRILVIWAENFEQQVLLKEPKHRPGCIAAIAGALMRFRPEGAPPLRFMDEFAELQHEFPSAEMLDGNGKVIVAGTKVQ